MNQIHIDKNKMAMFLLSLLAVAFTTAYAADCDKLVLSGVKELAHMSGTYTKIGEPCNGKPVWEHDNTIRGEYDFIYYSKDDSVWAIGYSKCSGKAQLRATVDTPTLPTQSGLKWQESIRTVWTDVPASVKCYSDSHGSSLKYSSQTAWMLSVTLSVLVLTLGFLFQ